MRRDIGNSTLAEDAAIDRFNLIEEMEVHPRLFEKWSSKVIEATKRRDHYKGKRDLLYSDFDAEIRANPEEYGFGERITETGIKSFITGQPDYRKLQKKRLSAERDINAYVAAVRTMEHRKRMLEKLVDTWLAGFFSENMTGRTRRAQRKVNRQTSEKVRRSIKRRSPNAKKKTEQEG